MANSLLTAQAGTRGVLRKVFLVISQNSQEKICARVSLEIKLEDSKETLVQLLSCEFSGISKSTFLTD